MGWLLVKLFLLFALIITNLRHKGPSLAKKLFISLLQVMYYVIKQYIFDELFIENCLCVYAHLFFVDHYLHSQWTIFSCCVFVIIVVIVGIVLSCSTHVAVIQFFDNGLDCFSSYRRNVLNSCQKVDWNLPQLQVNSDKW